MQAAGSWASPCRMRNKHLPVGRPLAVVSDAPLGGANLGLVPGVCILTGPCFDLRASSWAVIFNLGAKSSSQTCSH